MDNAISEYEAAAKIAELQRKMAEAKARREAAENENRGESDK